MIGHYEQGTTIGLTSSGSVFNGVDRHMRTRLWQPGGQTSRNVGRQGVIKGSHFSIDILTAGVLCMLYAQPDSAQERRGEVAHVPLMQLAVPDTANQDVAVYHVESETGGINKRNCHPQAINVRITSGTALCQEGSKQPVTMHAGAR